MCNLGLWYIWAKVPYIRYLAMRLKHMSFYLAFNPDFQYLNCHFFDEKYHVYGIFLTSISFFWPTKAWFLRYFEHMIFNPCFLDIFWNQSEHFWGSDFEVNKTPFFPYIFASFLKPIIAGCIEKQPISLLFCIFRQL